jgi:prevent-host-death family protein
MQVTIYEAKTRLSELIEAVGRGEGVIIARRNKPVACLGPVASLPGSSRIGGLKGKRLRMTRKFDDPALSEEVAKSFQGS